MHILLVNSNPVVSRLLALCTQDNVMKLEEVENITSLRRKQYDIVFVDENSYKNEVLELDQHINITKKILFSSEDINIGVFDRTIKKPFLPSEIIEILQTAQQITIENGPTRQEKKQNTIFPLSTEEDESEESIQILDRDEIDKIKTLLEMEDEEEVEVLSDDEIEMRKIEVIKEQLIADGLEIVEEEDIVDELNIQDAIKLHYLEGDKISVSKKRASKAKKRASKKKNQLTKKEKKWIKKAVKKTITSFKRKKIKNFLKGKKIKISIQYKGKK